MAALENLSPNGGCRHHQKAAARGNGQHWTGPFSPKSSAEELISTFTLSTTSTTFSPILSSLFHCRKDGSTRPLSLRFLHSHPFLKQKSPAAPTQSGPPLARCLPDTSVAPPVAVLCVSAFNHGGRSTHVPQVLPPPPTMTDGYRAFCESWLKPRVGKWLNPSLNPRKTYSLATVHQYRQILGSKGEEKKLGERGRSREAEISSLIKEGMLSYLPGHY